MTIQWKYSEKQIQGIRSDRVPEELWMKVRDTVQETGIKTTSKKKKCKKAKWLSEEALKTPMKRREAKGKGEKERSFKEQQGKRDKKAFLSDHCKEIAENNRRGKTRDLFKKIKDTKGTFNAKMGTMKNRNGMNLTLDFKEIQPVHPKGDQSSVFIGRIDVEAETPIL